MSQSTLASQHDAYAGDYDNQIRAYDCYIADLLFGLCYEYAQPGKRLLDAGIGSGLSAQLFAKAGLHVFGMDFSPAMLEICQAKGFAAGLMLHDIQQAPWPYPSKGFDFLVCCGVLHFIADLENIFAEARRVLGENGVFAFTTRVPPTPTPEFQAYHQETVGGFEIFSHAPAYLELLLAKQAFERLKVQKSFVGEDIFTLWVVRAMSMG